MVLHSFRAHGTSLNLVYTHPKTFRRLVFCSFGGFVIFIIDFASPHAHKDLNGHPLFTHGFPVYTTRI